MLLDPGSEGSLVSEACVQRLGLKRSHANFKVLGLSAVDAGRTRGFVRIKMSSFYHQKEVFDIEGYVLNKLTAAIPSSTINLEDLKHLRTLQLADPTFSMSNHVDLILGADYIFSMLFPGQIPE
ncbi:hypothetical protein JTE90_007417 [Oedothorax gibbosus]|uniref:Peptidase aspartic putative domain-containing protein n=1 Tax=Oedothorax gibbosus TaxID=931172 RepID=A0AAV6TQI9_9ARAC|nr:hypothetical protein JTE90_007417 [Oedothorax gibbosus]